MRPAGGPASLVVASLLVSSAAVAIPPGFEWAPDPRVAAPTEALSGIPCAGGMAGDFPCHGVDLLAFVPLADMGCGGGNDIWGWTDPVTQTEYALMGCNNGTSFIDLSDPENPVFVGRLPTHTVNSLWRDIKVYADHAFIVSEATGHGLQVFDLNELRDVTDPPVVFQAAAHLGTFGGAHNVAVNEDTGYAYVVGSNQCSGGLHIVDVQVPTSPQVAGCFSQDGYTHDTQCVIYQGPDPVYQGREICFNSNANTLTIVDVTDKSAPVMLARETYPGVGYTHQGWLTEDHHHFLLDDELDEIQQGHNTRTRIWDVSDLESPAIIGVYDSPVPATDHNQYVKGGFVYQSNYTAGLRILDLLEVADGTLTEVAFFDTYPANDAPGFNGTWSNYPFFDSDIVIVSTLGEGLFVVRPNLDPSAIEGVVTRSDTAAPLEGAFVEAVGPVTVSAFTEADGSYEIEAFPATYDVTASKEGFFPQTVMGVVVSEGQPVSVDFSLDPLPVASISPASFDVEIPMGSSAGDTLNVGNVGEGELTWSITTDVPASAPGLRGHDPALDEPIDIPDFQVISPPNGGSPVLFTLPGGVVTQGLVVGFHFIGTATGISGNASWASDTCMIVQAPDGASYAVGGFSGTQAGCNVNDWDFQGGGSSNNGTYQSTHDNIFPEAGDAGDWTFTFVNDWNSAGAATISWSNVTVTLFKAPLPICADVTEVPWLAVEPESGATPPGLSVPVDVLVDATNLDKGPYEALLCVSTNDPTQPLVVVPVGLEVFDPCPMGAHLVLQGMIVAGTEVFEACETITAGPDFTVTPTGDVTFRAGRGIILRGGFAVETGGAFTAEIDPELLP